jgi:uncharacterized protein (DUF885 family)
VTPARARVAAALFAMLCAGCARQEDGPVWSAVRERFFLGFLERNPITCTYLGGDGYDTRLAEVNARLPDLTAAGRAEAVAFYRTVLADLERIDPAALPPDDAIDRELVRSQILFLLRMEERRYPERALDTHTVAPFRGVDWQIQQMTDQGEGRSGSAGEWDRVVRRVRAIPAYLEAVEELLDAGRRSGNVPDRRMVRHDGTEAIAGHAAYFKDALPALAEGLTRGQPFAPGMLRDLRAAGAEAAASYEALGGWLGSALATLPAVDRFAAGEEDYDWRLRNNLKLPQEQSAARLYEYAAQEVAKSQALLIEVARTVAERRKLRLDWNGRAASLRSVRAVMDDLARDTPKDDAGMFRLYRSRAQDLVAYARRHAMFDLPQDYRLEIVPTPAMLESTLEAAYYPAPPFKTTGIGRFYLTASHGDPAVLRENNVHAVADLCAHEGFPGHDWHHQFMRARARTISGVRWLTPGAVEDSSSMWQDSLAAEGWALYAEQLMAEPVPGSPDGFYTPEERIYQLKWQVLRDARVRIDTGLHTGRMTFDEAVDYYGAEVELLPASCGTGAEAARAAACDTARRAVYRYSKWPTQAITYHLGKKEILDLRARAQAAQKERFSLRTFHERFMEQGTIPPGYFRERFLAEPAR